MLQMAVNLGIDNFSYSDLYNFQRLQDLAGWFDRFVAEHDPALFERFAAYRTAMQSGVLHGGLEEPKESALLIDVSRPLGAFLAQLFATDDSPLKQRAARDAEVARFKKEFVGKRVAKVQQVREDSDVLTAEVTALVEEFAGGPDHDPELAVAITANRLLDFEKTKERTDDLKNLIDWTAAEWKRGRFEGWTSFRLPKPMIFNQLVKTQPADDLRVIGDPHHLR